MSTNIGEQSNGTPVLVKWVDSKSWAGWQSRDAWREHLHDASCEVESLGFVINEDSTYLSLAQSWGTENAADVIQIPKAAIVSRVRVEKVPCKHDTGRKYIVGDDISRFTYCFDCNERLELENK